MQLPHVPDSVVFLHLEEREVACELCVEYLELELLGWYRVHRLRYLQKRRVYRRRSAFLVLRQTEKRVNRGAREALVEDPCVNAIDDVVNHLLWNYPRGQQVANELLLLLTCWYVRHGHRVSCRSSLSSFYHPQFITKQSTLSVDLCLRTGRQLVPHTP